MDLFLIGIKLEVDNVLIAHPLFFIVTDDFVLKLSVEYSPKVKWR